MTGKVLAVDGEPVMSVSHVDNAAPPGLASRIDAVPVGELLDGRAPEGTLFARGEVQGLADRRFLGTCSSAARWSA